MYNPDIYDNGTPLYSTAQDIYDALCEKADDEMNLIGEIFPDVSYEGQEWYYSDNIQKLKRSFGGFCDHGEKMWIMDLAMFQLAYDDERTGVEIHEIVYNAMVEPELAKRIGFKKLFIENVLGGYAMHYKDIHDECLDEIIEVCCDACTYDGMVRAFKKIIYKWGLCFNPYNNPYNNLANAVANKVRGLRLDKEKQLISECRAMLNSYDDYIRGLKINQQLSEHMGQIVGARLEREYQKKLEGVKAEYGELFRQLLLAAEEQGVRLNAVQQLHLTPATPTEPSQSPNDELVHGIWTTVIPETAGRK